MITLSTVKMTLLKMRLALIFLLVWILPALACNFPAATPQPSQLDERALQTLVAELYATAQVPTPAPGEMPLPELPPFTGLRTATPAFLLSEPTEPPTPGMPSTHFLYVAQAGDTLPALVERFGVSPEQITSPTSIHGKNLLDPGQLLSIPNLLDEAPYPGALLPDSEVIYSPSTVDFHIGSYIQQAGGFLSTYEERVDDQWLSGADIVRRVALNTSINPRLLLAFLEFRSQWVSGLPQDPENLNYPIGFYVPGYEGLYKELSLVAKQLGIAYYSWRSGTLTELQYSDRSIARISPDLNAGSVALQYLFSKIMRQAEWQAALYGPQNFLQLHQQLFGDPWARAGAVEPLFPPGLVQPTLELPFAPGERWSLTAGPHSSWATGSPRGALDFAPVTGEPKCAISRAWVRASAAGVVARSEDGLLVLDLDGDGFEQTGWALLYLHIADHERAPLGAWIDADFPLGHPSCEGGVTTGTHLHFSRKYNGEWIAADGPLPFMLSGWEAQAGTRPFEGILVKDDWIVSANPGGDRTSIIVRQE